jgi:hypothetical protein
LVEVKAGSSPYTILFFLLPALALNLLVVVYPLIIEGMIIRAPPPVWTGLDWWFAKSIFGNFSDFPYSVFIPFLLGLYLISFLIGLLIAVLLLRPIFSRLLRNHEVTFSNGRLFLRVAMDFIVVFYLTWFALDRILAYLMQYPWPLSIMSSSYMFFYTITGFITGNCIGKSVFPLRLYRLCRRDRLELKVLKIVNSAVSEGPRDSVLTKWELMRTAASAVKKSPTVYHAACGSRKSLVLTISHFRSGKVFFASL